MAVLLSIAAAISVMLALYRVYMPVKVLAPNKDIPAGALIGQGDIGFVTISKRDKHPLAVTDPGQVIGKYARDNLYSLDAIISKNIVTDPKEINGFKTVVGQDETCMTLKQSEVRWPQDTREGDTVTAVSILTGGNPQVVARKIKVLSVSETGKSLTGTVEQIKNTVSSSSESGITLALQWEQVGPLLFGKTQQELWLLPEKEGYDLTGDIYPPGQLESLLAKIHQKRTDKGVR